MQWVDLFGRGRLFQLVRKSLVAIGSYWWLSLTNDQVCVRCAPWERRCIAPPIDLHTKIPSTSLFCANLRCLRCLNTFNLLTIYLPTNVPSTLFHANLKGQEIWRKNFLKESVLLCQVLSSAFPSLASCWCWLPGAESFHTWLYFTSWQATHSFTCTGQGLKERLSKSMRLSGVGFHKNWVSHQSCIV